MTKAPPISWTTAFLRARPDIASLPPEAQRSFVAEYLLGRLCTDIEREYGIATAPPFYRVDLKGVLPNGEFALVEVKAFDQYLSSFVDAIMQAASYASCIEYPVFIGPVEGNKGTICTGTHDNAIGALHLIAGRLNVGFLCVSAHGAPSLLLRGQNLIDARGISDTFAKHWGFRTRLGSRTVRS